MPNEDGYYWAHIVDEWIIVQIKRGCIWTISWEHPWHESEIKEWGPRIEQYENKEK